MAKRALLVAISKYPSPIGKLDAATDEADRWADILRVPYGFDIEILPNEKATRTEVTKHLRNYLFKDAKADDELVFFYAGHGSRVTPSGGGKSQETLFLYPEETGERLRKSALFTAQDFSEIVTESSVPAGVRIDVILDTCFAAAFGPLPPGVVDLFVSVEESDPEGRRPLERFGRVEVPPSDRRRFKSRNAAEWGQLCLIVAAAGERESAKQLPLTPPRFVFSMLALEELNKYPKDSYRALVENIKKKAAQYKQQPDLYGNLGRQGFEFLSSKPPSIGADTGASAGSVSSTQTISRTLTIRIAGICCFVSKAVASDPFVKRLVLPYDDIGGGPLDTHIPFIEVRDDQMLPNADKSFLSDPYNHREYAKTYDDAHPHHDQYVVDGTTPEEFYYRRFVLSGHTITIPYVDTSGALTVSTAFSNHIPGMKTVTTDLFPYPRPEVFYTTPQAGLISAFFDISYGTLDIGSLYEFTTLFVTKQTGTVNAEYQTPEFVTLLLPLLLPEGVPLTIQVKKDATTYEIMLDDTTDTITIGNEIDIDILGLESGDDITNHFELYYNLASPPRPPDRAEPIKLLEPINSCTVTTWP